VKKCPFCGEEIRVEAVICRYCKADLKENKPPEEKHQKTTVGDGMRIGCGIIIVLGILFFIIMVFGAMNSPRYY